MTEIVDTDNKPLLDWLVASIRSHADRLSALESHTIGPAICPDPTGEGSAWQGSPTPAEPAPGSDAEHPPEGYALVPRCKGEKVEANWIIWAFGKGPWEPLIPPQIGDDYDTGGFFPCARPIPANEGDSQKAGLSEKIAESVVQDLQQACYDRDVDREIVERLTAELDTTKRLLAESLVERDRLKNLHDARKVRIDGFRDVLREHLGDLR